MMSIMKLYKKIILTVLIIFIALGCFTGFVFIETAIKDSYDKREILDVNSETEYSSIAPQYGYYMDLSKLNAEEAEKESFSVIAYNRKGKLKRADAHINYEYNALHNEFSDIDIDMTTNPTRSTLYAMTKMNFTNGVKTRAKARDGSYKEIKEKIGDKEVYGVTFIEREGESYEYGFLVKCRYASDCDVKIQLIIPIDRYSYNEAELYQKCIEKTELILNAVKAPANK